MTIKRVVFSRNSGKRKIDDSVKKRGKISFRGTLTLEWKSLSWEE